MVLVLETLKNLVIDPIIRGDLYNPVNTAIYAVLFIAGVEVLWKYFARKENQKEMRMAILPFIVLAGLVRFADSRWWPRNPLTVTPGIFILISGLFIGLYKWLGPKRTREVGTTLAVIVLLLNSAYLHFTKALWILPVLAITAVWFFILRKLPFMSDYFAWTPHIFEAWITSFGVYFGLIEEHVLARSLMQFNPFAFGLVKTLLIPVIMYLIRDTEKSQKVYVGTIIGAIGLGPAIRDLFEFLSL